MSGHPVLKQRQRGETRIWHDRCFQSHLSAIRHGNKFFGNCKQILIFQKQHCTYYVKFLRIWLNILKKHNRYYSRNVSMYNHIQYHYCLTGKSTVDISLKAKWLRWFHMYFEFDFPSTWFVWTFGRSFSPFLLNTDDTLTEYVQMFHIQYILPVVNLNS